MGVCFDFSPQPHNQHIDGAVKHVHRFAVGEFQQLVTRQDLTRVPHHRAQQGIFTLS